MVLTTRGPGRKALHGLHKAPQSASASPQNLPPSHHAVPWLSLILSLALPLLASASVSNICLRPTSLFLSPFDLPHLAAAVSSRVLTSRAPTALREAPPSTGVVWDPGQGVGIKARLWTRCALPLLPQFTASALSSLTFAIPEAPRSQVSGTPFLCLGHQQCHWICIQGGPFLDSALPPVASCQMNEHGQRTPVWPCTPPCGPGCSCSPELSG